jgi:hypothetical protein
MTFYKVPEKKRLALPALLKSDYVRGDRILWCRGADGVIRTDRPVFVEFIEERPDKFEKGYSMISVKVWGARSEYRPAGNNKFEKIGTVNCPERVLAHLWNAIGFPLGPQK